jgi:hypothetical protein
VTSSSNVKLKWLKLAANGIAAWASWSPASRVFADENVDALLTQPADTL